MKCEHDDRAVCWLCDWAGQPWWPEARRRAIETGVLCKDDLDIRVRLLMRYGYG